MMEQAGERLSGIILHEKQYATKVITVHHYRVIALFYGTTALVYEMVALISEFIKARFAHSFIGFM
ncbi:MULTISPECIES: hypothetical protein [Vibrio]|uniref:hypothetical protein n=1 Tax=Vibrio TaxID=662 RepID=UPI00037B6DED|nr:hypothetical protein [Vibrio splendidus]OEF21983.1 hypothetical protein A145_09795 [Vibrio splendidus 5S-101]PMG54798.1 hypothetical protein BCU88_19375 [Vibrio splendidus]PMJ33468.1 hypothetical protein BCU26_00925 [Vibrio splendidus]PTO70545.1 hypothetical protein CWN81_16140 [Vibrio splendidus]